MFNDTTIPLGNFNFSMNNDELLSEILMQIIALQAESRALRELTLKNSAIIQERSFDEIDAEYKLSLIENAERIRKDVSERFPPTPIP